MTAPKPDLDVVRLAPVDEVLLGDVVDSVDGPIRVTEIVQRSRRWELAGDPPDHCRGYHDRDGAPLLRRRVTSTDVIRVHRTVHGSSPLRGHARNVHSHDPKKRGWYTIPNGYDAACACGWKHPETEGSKAGAKVRWLEHKAAVLTEQAYAANSALRLITQLSRVHALPSVPWTFRTIRVGEFSGGGVATADVRGVPVGQAHTLLQAWADVLEVSYRYLEAVRPHDAAWGWRTSGTRLGLRASGPDHASVILDLRTEDPGPHGRGIVPKAHTERLERIRQAVNGREIEDVDAEHAERICSSSVSPSSEDLEAIANAAGVSVMWLLYGEAVGSVIESAEAGSV
ncbi:hypothetical protein ACIRH0_03765 [Streptomyces sp. NPDC093675]|uniref:hypothetical protein n=1 Tax=Streptomyces sp. NPDC093675 TaxID=3366049 RepID=UPI0038069B7A